MPAIVLVLALMERAPTGATDLSADALAPVCGAGSPAGASPAFLTSRELLVQPAVPATPVVASDPSQEGVRVAARVNARHRLLDSTTESCLDAPAS